MSMNDRFMLFTVKIKINIVLIGLILLQWQDKKIRRKLVAQNYDFSIKIVNYVILLMLV